MKRFFFHHRNGCPSVLCVSFWEETASREIQESVVQSGVISFCSLFSQCLSLIIIDSHYDLHIRLAVHKPITLLFCAAENIFEAGMHTRMVLYLSVSSNVTVIPLVAQTWMWICLLSWKGIFVTSYNSEIWYLFYSLKKKSWLACWYHCSRLTSLLAFFPHWPQEHCLPCESEDNEEIWKMGNHGNSTKVSLLCSSFISITN